MIPKSRNSFLPSSSQSQTPIVVLAKEKAEDDKRKLLLRILTPSLGIFADSMMS